MFKFAVAVNPVVELPVKIRAIFVFLKVLIKYRGLIQVIAAPRIAGRSK